ncbi:MAG: hypothetical protein KBT22_01185 [Bacteroidales bacterium]|nr:hypothetical protein [Candidatus Scybalocola fimicaballi]
MEFLSLYIDKYYIIGGVVSAEITDQGSYNLCGYSPLKLTNSEDRVWLYFFEDESVDAITYGLSNKIHCENGELHYIEGSVFDNIVNKYSEYKLRGIQKKMSCIFEDSKIFDVFKSGFENNQNIETFVSYSSDICISARNLFNDLLSKHGFLLNQHIAGIDELSFEKYRRTANNVLVLSACNENLNLSLFNNGSVFTKQLKARGLDLRQKALVKLAVNNINKTAHVLKSVEQIDDEIVRLMPKAEDWLRRLDASSMPIKLNISFAVDLNTEYNPQVKKSEVEGYTQDLINELSLFIHDFVKENGVNDYEMEKIVFIGDLFNNELLRQAIMNYYSCDFELVSISDLPSIVSYYTQMDCSRFKEREDDFRSIAEAELHKLHTRQEQHLREEEFIRTTQADREKAEEQTKKRKAFDTLKSKYKDAARDLRWKDAIDTAREAKQALDTKSPDYTEEISNIEDDIEEYQSRLTEQNMKFDIFRKEIKLARDFFESSNWEDAIKHADKALDATPDAEEAKRIISDSRKKIEEKGKIKEYITRSTLLLGQKNYEEALEEIEEGLKLERANDDLLVLKNEITIKAKEFNDKVVYLSNGLDIAILRGDLELASQKIAELIEFDNAHSAKWFDKKNEVRELIREKEQFENKLKILKSDIDLAYKLKQWDKVLTLSSDYLSEKNDSEVVKIKIETESRIEEIKQTNMIIELFDEIDSLISEQKYSIAEKKVKFLQNEYPEERDRCKKILAKIFDLEDEEEKKKKNVNRRSDNYDSDDFFNEKPLQQSNVKKFSSGGDDDFFNEKTLKKSNNKKKGSDDGWDF